MGRFFFVPIQFPYCIFVSKRAGWLAGGEQANGACIMAYKRAREFTIDETTLAKTTEARIPLRPQEAARLQLVS